MQVPYAITCSKITIITVISLVSEVHVHPDFVQAIVTKHKRLVEVFIICTTRVSTGALRVTREDAACSQKCRTFAITSIDSTKIQKIKQSSSSEQTIIPKVTTENKQLGASGLLRRVQGKRRWGGGDSEKMVGSQFL